MCGMIKRLIDWFKKKDCHVSKNNLLVNSNIALPEERVQTVALNEDDLLILKFREKITEEQFRQVSAQMQDFKLSLKNDEWPKIVMFDSGIDYEVVRGVRDKGKE